MTLYPVIVPVPPDDAPRTARQVQAQRVAARGALAESARRAGAPIDGWNQDDNGVPVSNGGFRWSVSHTRGYAAAVVATHPVGIDIEQVRPRPRPLHDALACGDEWTVIGDRSWESFFAVWTAKEAVLKSHGQGIAYLLDCRLLARDEPTGLTLEYAGRRVRIDQFRFDGHIAAVTVGDEPVEWTVAREPACGSVHAVGVARETEPRL